MAWFETVPVVDITKDNFHHLLPTIQHAIKSASFIAMDTELSGIGTRKLLMAKSIEDRYIGMSENAKTRSIVSFGISCFKLEGVGNIDGEIMEESHNDSGASVWKYTVQTYNLMTLCSEEYVVEPNSLKFLLNHGFDFNRQYSSGIPYYRGNDQINSEEPCKLRQLFTQIILANKPVVFHNALMDLIYLYQNFYANLPSQMSTFLSDLTEVFTAGIIDTKYIADYVQMMTASYLEYVFSKGHRENCIREKQGKSFVAIQFPQCSHPDVVNRCSCPLPSSIGINGDVSRDTLEVMRGAVCESFAGHGWCEAGISCSQSHDMDLILDLDSLGQTKEVRKRKRRNKNKQQADIKNGSGPVENSDDMETEQASNLIGMEESSVADGVPKLPAKYQKGKSDLSTAGCHRAGFDSFMTGFTLAVWLTEVDRYTGKKEGGNLGLEKFKNNISLSGKDMPLTITKSSFAKTSKDHRDKMERIRKDS